MKELSIFVDESGEMQGNSKYYLLTLVFHDQSKSISPALKSYENSLNAKSLPNIPLHVNPLMNGKDDYSALTLETRKRLLNAFNVFTQNLPICYITFAFKRKEYNSKEKLYSVMRRDIAYFFTQNIEFLQTFDHVKFYYDGGQSIVSNALKWAARASLSKQAVRFKNASFQNYRLAQVADYYCAIELAKIKYEAHEATSTDVKIYGYVGTFKNNYLKQAKRKRLKR